MEIDCMHVYNIIKSDINVIMCDSFIDDLW